MNAPFELGAAQTQIAVNPRGFVHSVSVVTSPEAAARFESTMTRQQMKVVRLSAADAATWLLAHSYAVRSGSASLLERLTAGEVPELTPEQLEEYGLIDPKTAREAFGGTHAHKTPEQPCQDEDSANAALFPEYGIVAHLPAFSFPEPPPRDDKPLPSDVARVLPGQLPLFT